jgi:hypothetical protein
MTEETYQAAKTIKNKILFCKSRIKIYMGKENFMRYEHTYKNDLSVQGKADQYAKEVTKWRETMDKLINEFKAL